MSQESAHIWICNHPERTFCELQVGDETTKPSSTRYNYYGCMGYIDAKRRGTVEEGRREERKKGRGGHSRPCPIPLTSITIAASRYEVTASFEVFSSSDLIGKTKTGEALLRETILRLLDSGSAGSALD